MKLIAFGASNSRNSINRQFAEFVAKELEFAEPEILDLNDYPLPLYSIDLEQEAGIPNAAIAFYEKIQSADFLLISLAEHNGTYTTAFKNMFDWMSRHNVKLFENTSLFLVSTAPGGRGGRGVMDAALLRFPLHGANILGHFCLPFFKQNFDAKHGITEETLNAQFRDVLADIRQKLGY